MARKAQNPNQLATKELSPLYFFFNILLLYIFIIYITFLFTLWEFEL